MSAMTPVSPQWFGKYRVLDQLGKGAMGVVYLAEDPDLQRRVAIKTLHAISTQQDPDALQRFRNEALAVGRLHHPGIVAVHDYGVQDDQAYLVMEYVEGRHLGHCLREATLLPDADVISVMTQLLDALQHAHERGVWHRDIKPSNLMVTRSGHLKLTDFGIARIDDHELTRAGSVIGTPHYMAPEQHLAERIDARVDIWAAGVLLYQMLTGHLPFKGSVDSVIYQVLHSVPPPPSQCCAGRRMPVDDAVVLKALNREPGQRFASARLFRDTLQARVTWSPADTLSEATVVLAQAAPSALPAAQHGSTAMPTGWDATVLQDLETRLTAHLGPVARVLVRRTARDCSDVDTLKRRLAGHLDESARRRFLQDKVNTGTAGSGGRAAERPTATRPLPSSSAGRPTTLGQAPFRPDDAQLQRLSAVLVVHLGPISRVLVRREAQQATSADDLVQRLGTHLQGVSSRAAIEQAMRNCLT